MEPTRHYEIVIFSYNDNLQLKDVLEKSLKSRAVRIILIGGGSLPYDYISGIKDGRFLFIRQQNRVGKPRSVIQALPIIQEEIVAMVSGDVEIEEGTFDMLVSQFEDGVGALFARIIPSFSKGFFPKLASLLWTVNHYQISYLLKMGLPAHAGELLFIRRECLQGYTGEINEDAFFCLNAFRMGYKIKYVPEIVVKSIPIRNLNEYLIQRRRINYGHWELKMKRMEPYSISTLSLGNVKQSFEILHEVVKKERESVFYLAVLIFLEFASSTIAKLDILTGRSHSVWRLISRDDFKENVSKR